MIDRMIHLKKQGLLLHTCLKRPLAKLRIHLTLYYWSQEHFQNGPPPRPRLSGPYHFRKAEPDDLIKLAQHRPHPERALKYMHRLEADGCTCFVIVIDGQCASSMWSDPRGLQIPWPHKALTANEVYLNNMVTAAEFRGLALAPTLRYQVFKYLEKEGYDTFYSFTECFNTPAKNLKLKLGVNVKWLGLKFRIFRYVKGHIILRRFKT